jgi:ribosomal-protein-alanine N-acetyltransferase
MAAERRGDDSPAVLRAMRDDDVPAVMAIEVRAYPFPWTAGIFHDCLRAGYCCHVVERDGVLVGYGVMSAGAREAHILNVCVSPEERGRGYGRMLMERMIEQARRLQAEMMFLEVRPSNQVALHLYAQLGFNEIGTRNNYYPAERGREDALLLAKQL